jgi:hypothetical protein
MCALHLLLQKDPRRRRGENQKFQGTKEMGGEMESERGVRWKELGKCLEKREIINCFFCNVCFCFCFVKSDSMCCVLFNPSKIIQQVIATNRIHFILTLSVLNSPSNQRSFDQRSSAL